MTYFFPKKYHPPGTAPGTLTAAAPAAYRIHLIDYTESDLTEKELSNVAECRDYVDRPSTTWIHVQGGITADVVRKLGDVFGLHPLAMEDVLNSGQRPKLDRFEEQIFIAMALPAREATSIVMEQASLFLLSAISNRLNDVMRVLTVISTIFIPLTFITGIYGMNFGNNTNSPWAMSELRWYFGYPLALLLMLTVAIGMLVYFRRKKWL